MVVWILKKVQILFNTNASRSFDELQVIFFPYSDDTKIKWEKESLLFFRKYHLLVFIKLEKLLWN